MLPVTFDYLYIYDNGKIIGEDDSNVTMEIPCKTCLCQHTVTFPKIATERYRLGALLQDAFETLSPSDRELIKTGICGDCFRELFEYES